MMILPVICFLVGVVLAQYCKVLALLPAMPIALFLAIVVGVASPSAIWTTVLVAAANVVGLQMGYFVGIILHSLLTRTAAAPTPLSSSAPARRSAH
jgi:membrane protein DedA with SNARE-associated domain